MSQTPPAIQHFPKGDLTSANARLAELRAKEGSDGNRRKNNPCSRRFTVSFSMRLFSLMKERAIYEDCSVTMLLRQAINEYLHAHREHLE